MVVPERHQSGVSDVGQRGAGARPSIEWAQLTNPVISYAAAAVKDQCLVCHDGLWHMVFDYIEDGAAAEGYRRNIAVVRSVDFVRWSAPAPWPLQQEILGVASPEVVRSPSGLFVACYQSSPGSRTGRASKLFYRSSQDLVTWSEPRPLGHSLHPAENDRMIDAAVAWVGDAVVLGYKYGGESQAFEVAWSPSGDLDGRWMYIGRPDISINGDTVENYQFLVVDGRWTLVATSNTGNRPWIFSIAGDGTDPESWLHWVDGHELEIAEENWNSAPGFSGVTYEHANSAHLVDRRQEDGYWYLTYSGCTELTRYDRLGHGKIGVARSCDLVDWKVPPET